MSMSMYQATVPIFVQMLNGLTGVLDKAEAHANERKIDQAIFLNYRLFPNMWALTKEVQAATDFARNTTARLAGQEPLAIEETEKSIAELKARIKKTIEYIQGFKPEQIDGTEDKVLNLKMGGRDVSIKGQAYLVDFALPNFYFFCTTAYNILRHNGVELVKRDYLGKAPGS